MEIPKTQKELVQLLYEQDKRLREQDKKIEAMRRAMMVMDRRLVQTAKLMESSRHHTRKLQMEATDLKKIVLETLSGNRYG